MTGMQPTDEQQAAIRLFDKGGHFKMEAGAGTGKTSTLALLARSAPHRRGTYIAFNKPIVQDARRAMPRTVFCSTAHSLAYRDIGKNYDHRLKSGKMKGADMARLLGLDPLQITYNDKPKRLSPGWLASQVIKMVRCWCQSADPVITERHLPWVDGIDFPQPGRRNTTNNAELARHLLPYAHKAWADLGNQAGRLPFEHAHYLKSWQLSQPLLAGDYLLMDEAQDLAPVILDVIEAQAEHSQLVYVGDSQQEIYGWTGAVNALDRVDVADTCWLSQSFRFGPAIAAVANYVLTLLDAELYLIGSPDIDSQIAQLHLPDCVLTRTNAEAITQMLHYQLAGHKVALVGGSDEVTSFAKGAAALLAGDSTAHPLLACFDSWPEVQEYAAMDPLGDDLKLLVRLIDEFGTDVLLAALDQTIPEADASVIVSTAHKSKGRQWAAVTLAADFPDPRDKPDRDPDGELRLLYVAATRARLALDIGQVAILQGADR